MIDKEKFINLFGLPKDGFQDPVELQNIDIGFSVYKDRSEPGFKSLFRVFINDSDNRIDSIIKPIIVTASYGKETESGITISSTDFKRTVHWPLDIISRDDFFYDTSKNKFFYKNKEILPFDILKKIDDLHLKPTKNIRGFFLRIKLLLFLEWLQLVPKILNELLYVVSGDREETNIIKRTIDKRSQKNDKISKVEIPGFTSKKLNIFGYEASQWAVGLYAVLHLTMFFLYEKVFHWHWPTVVKILDNNFLTVMYVISSLGFLDKILPKFLRYLIDKSSDFAIKKAFEEIRIAF